VHELAVAEVVGTDVADVALTATIDQDQGVVCRQPSHGDADVAVLVLSAAHIDTFNVTKGIRKTGIRFGLQLVTANDRDAGRRVRDLLLETRSGHHDGIDTFRSLLLSLKSGDRGSDAQRDKDRQVQVGGAERGQGVYLK